jgi:hypothetical protein
VTSRSTTTISSPVFMETACTCLVHSTIGKFYLARSTFLLHSLVFRSMACLAGRREGKKWEIRRYDTNEQAYAWQMGYEVDEHEQFEVVRVAIQAVKDGTYIPPTEYRIIPSIPPNIGFPPPPPPERVLPWPKKKYHTVNQLPPYTPGSAPPRTPHRPKRGTKFTGYTPIPRTPKHQRPGGGAPNRSHGSNPFQADGLRFVDLTVQDSESDDSNPVGPSKRQAYASTSGGSGHQGSSKNITTMAGNTSVWNSTGITVG